MPNPSDTLSELYTRFVAKHGDEVSKHIAEMNHKNTQKVKRLAEQDVITVDDLIQRIPEMTLAQKNFGIWLISISIFDKRSQSEAEDAIHCIEYGNWRGVEAAERWLGNKERGPRDLSEYPVH